MREGWLGSIFQFFLSAGRVTLLHETADFLHMKGIKIFGYEIVVEKESEKISKFSKKIIGNPCNFDRKEYSSCPLDDRTVFIIIWRRIEVSNLDRQKGFSMYLGGNCRWVPLSTIA